MGVLDHDVNIYNVYTTHTMTSKHRVYDEYHDSMINIDHHWQAMIRHVPLPVSRKFGLVFPPSVP